MRFAQVASNSSLLDCTARNGLVAVNDMARLNMKSDQEKRKGSGGIIHSYQKYDPVSYPPPSQPPPDLVTPAFEQALWSGSFESFSEEDLANAVRLDPSQIAGLGPSVDSLRAMLEERKRKILST